MLILLYLLFQETTLLDSMFDVPGSDVTTVVVNGKVVQGEEAAAYIRGNKSKENMESAEDSGCEDEEELKLRQS